MGKGCRWGRRFNGCGPAVIICLTLKFVTMSLLNAQPRVLSQSLSSAGGGISAKPQAMALAITSVTVVDVADGPLHPGQTVVVVGNRIRLIGPAGKVRIPLGARVVDAQGKYLIPGLWDMHAHLKNDEDVSLAQHEIPFYSALIAQGVTGVRELGQWFRGGTDTFRLWQYEVMAGSRVGPRAVGPSVDLAQSELRIKTPEDARRIIDSLKAAGMVFLKYHAVAAIAKPDLYFMILREARRAGLPLVGHVPDGVTEAEAADSGQRSVEHVNENNTCWPALKSLDSIAIAERCGLAARAYIHNGTWLTPTLTTFYHYGHSPPNVQRFVQVMRRHGVTQFLAGTDTGPSHRRRRGIWPGVSLLEELVFLAGAGLTSLEALQSATLNPARFFNATDSLGTVGPGKLADLVLLNANPLADIRNVMKIQAVIANGRYFDRAALDALDPEGNRRRRAFAEQQAASVPAASTTP